MYHQELITYMDYHINWLSNLNNDINLLSIKNSDSIIELKNFFKYPTESFSEFIETYDDYMKMRYSLARIYERKEIYLTLEEYCKHFVLCLENVLSIIYNKMIEKTIEKQLIINSLLNNKRSFDLRNEVKSYLFNNSLPIYDRFFNKINI